MEDTEHTEGKWEIRQKDCGPNYVQIYCGDYCVLEICTKDSNGLEDAKRIVKCANGWDELVDACKKALELIEDLEYAGEPVRENNYKFLEKAIANAERKE